MKKKGGKRNGMTVRKDKSANSNGGTKHERIVNPDEENIDDKSLGKLHHARNEGVPLSDYISCS